MVTVQVRHLRYEGIGGTILVGDALSADGAASGEQVVCAVPYGVNDEVGQIQPGNIYDVEGAEVTYKDERQVKVVRRHGKLTP